MLDMNFAKYFLKGQKEESKEPKNSTTLKLLKKPIHKKLRQITPKIQREQGKEERKKDRKKLKNKLKGGIKDRIKGELKGSKFRLLNEQLYTQKGATSAEYFRESPSEFAIYHEGYSQMMNKWPKNPLQIIIKELSKEQYKNM